MERKCGKRKEVFKTHCMLYTLIVFSLLPLIKSGKGKPLGEGAPHFDRVILASTDDGLPVWTDRYTPNFICMAGEGAHFFAAREVPHLDRLIVTCTDEGLPIWTDRYTHNTIYMTSEGAHFFA